MTICFVVISVGHKVTEHCLEAASKQGVDRPRDGLARTQATVKC